MNPWFFLLLCVAVGGTLLAQPGPVRFRGSTLLGFLIVTLGLTSPLPLYLTRLMLAGSSGSDAFVGAWNLWWTHTAAAEGVNPLFSSWVFYPEGTSLALHGYSLTYGVLTLPFQWLHRFLLPGAHTGAAALDSLFLMYNLVVIASFTTCGYFTYRLSLLLTRHRTASILAGLIFAYTNYRFANIVRLHLLGSEFLVLAVWAWVSFLRHPRPRQLVWLTGSLVFVAYDSLGYAACAVILFLVAGIAEIVARPAKAGAPSAPGGQAFVPEPEPEHRKRAWVGAALLSVVLGGLLLLPLGLGLTRQLAQGGTALETRAAPALSADLLDAFIPNARHPLWGRLFAGITARFHGGDPGFGQAIGWVTLGLFLVSIGSIFRSRAGRRWFWGFLIFFVLALGPVLHVGGHPLGRSMLPQALLSKALPFVFGATWNPTGYAAPASLCLALAVACGWAALRRRQGFADPPAKRAGASKIEVIVGAVLIFESLAAPLPLLRVPVPEVYAQIPPSPGYYALAALPGFDARTALLYQIVHRERLPQSVEDAILAHSPRPSSPFDTARWEELARNLGTPGWIESQPDENRAQLIDSLRRMLSDTKVRWVVLQRTRPVLAPDGLSFSSESLCNDATFEAIRANLTKLWPTLVRDINGDALFMFETTEIQD